MDASTPPVLLPSLPTSDALAQSIEDSFSNSAHSGSARNSSGPDEAVFDSNPESHSTRQSSPHLSSDYESNGGTNEEDECADNVDDDLISSLPAESRTPSLAPFPQHEPLPYTPPKTRSPFRNPSSVRGMQLDLTPPHLRSPTSTSRRSHQSHTQYNRLSANSRTSTPRSMRSHFSTRHHHSSQKPASPPKPRKEHPLVLLHVTLLPVSFPYSVASLTSIAPPHILANWNLLREKVPDTVLERGILIPHPREDYELLEERLLESLEVTVPRILKCGHFHMSPEEEAVSFREEREREELAADTACEGEVCMEDHPNGADAEEDDEESKDPDLCVDCGRRVRDGRIGSAGKGSKRWEIRIYAANGLMRAGAWSAAWREMERVDVEICPWMEDSVRRELEDARATEEREATMEEIEAAGAVREGEGAGFMDEGRLREVYGEEGGAEDGEAARGGEGRDQAFIDGLDDNAEHLETRKPRPDARPSGRGRKPSTRTRQRDVPLQELLANYLRLLFRDGKNVALAILTFLILLLALRPNGTQKSIDASLLAPPAALVSSPAEVPSISTLSEVVPATLDAGKVDSATKIEIEKSVASNVSREARREDNIVGTEDAAREL